MCARSRHPSTLSLINKLGRLLKAQGSLTGAAELFLEALAGKSARFGVEHAKTKGTAKEVVELLRQLGRDQEAAALAEKHGV